MTGHLHTILRDRADELDPWDLDVGSIVATGDRVVRRRRLGLGGAGLALAVAAVTAVTLRGPAHDASSTVRPGFATSSGRSGTSQHSRLPQHRRHRVDPASPANGGKRADQVHTEYFDVPTPPDGFHVVGSQPSFAAITLDGTVDDLYRDTNTGLPQADITQILRVQYHAFAADPLEKAQDPDLGEATQYDGHTFYHNTTWSPDVDYVQYQRGDGSWLRLQYPKRDHFATLAMVRYLDGVAVNPGAVPQPAGGAPQG